MLEAVVEHDDRRTAIHQAPCADDAVGFLDVIHAGEETSELDGLVVGSAVTRRIRGEQPGR